MKLQPKEPRHIRKEKKEFQDVLLKLANAFFQYRLLLEGNLTILKPEQEKKLEVKLLTLNQVWVQYVYNWNKNPKHHLKIRKEDFMNLVLDKLNHMESKQNEQN